MRITISGPPGSGTTSLARFLAEKHGYRVISAGEVFRTLAKERDMDLAEFGILAETDPAVDKLIDERQKEIGESNDDIIIEGRLAGHMVTNADLRIWVSASLLCRAVRISQREGIDEDLAREQTAERDACEAVRYAKYYDINISDLSAYDLVISSEKWGREELGNVVDLAVRSIRS